MRRVVTAIGGKKALLRIQSAVIGPKERHELRSMRGQIAGRNAPRGPGLSGVLIQLIILAGG